MHGVQSATRKCLGRNSRLKRTRMLKSLNPDIVDLADEDIYEPTFSVEDSRER